MSRGLAVLFFISQAFLSAGVQAFETAPNVCEKTLTAVIVDPFSSGRFLAPLLIERGYRVVGVQTSERPALAFVGTLQEKDFFHYIVYDQKLEPLLQKLQGFGVSVVSPGAESGVLLADQIAFNLHERMNGSGPRTNGILPARRNKGLMAGVLAEHGIPHVRQFSSANAEEIIAWAYKEKLWESGGRVVIKPLESAGTDNISFCTNEDEVRAAVQRVLAAPTVYWQPNQAVLAQEFLQGFEYVVDTVSCEGIHKISDIWRYTKREIPGAGAVYDYDDLLPYEGEIQRTLIAYAKQVLDAFKISYGPTHLEIKMTPRGPILVEINVRMAGAAMPRIVQEATGQSQIPLTIEALVDPVAFKKRPDGYTLQQHVRTITVNSDGNNRTMKTAFLETLLKLPGYKRHYFRYPEGAVISKSVDMTSSVADIELLHPDPAVIESSFQAIKKWERENFSRLSSRLRL